MATDRNRERQWDDHPGERARSEKEDPWQRQSPQDRNQGQQSERGSSWWRREALTVADVMTTKVKSVEPDATFRDVAQIMRQEDVGVVPVVRPDGRLYGLVTDRDIVIRGLTSGKAIDDCRARDVATKDIEVALVNDAVSEVIDLMGRHQIRRVPVVDESDRLIGIVSLGDIANRADYHEDLQRAFEEISGRRSFWSRVWR